MPNKIHWRKLTEEERGGKRWKYELTEYYIHKVDLGDESFKCGEYIEYSAILKCLFIWSGYRWDGSTAVLDTVHCMRASLVHDALCQLIGEGLLDRNYRKQADKVYRKIMIEDNAWRWWAGVRYTGLRIWAGWKFARRYPLFGRKK